MGISYLMIHDKKLVPEFYYTTDTKFSSCVYSNDVEDNYAQKLSQATPPVASSQTT